ncbi:MAG TPA: dTDP-4-dehydrorhamnose reductase [Vicinamibacteria bacterium]|nr:dTDP-4-dehydrorhamnose reductase [Vicinamibacteria bacterium]
MAGAGGQLGRALVQSLGDRAAWAPERHQLDIADLEAVRAAVARVHPDVVINAAAYNKVDAAETAPADALSVNAAGTLHLARAAAEAGALFVHVSTDYVFDGAQSRPYGEDDPPRPLNAYGVSKRAGEMMVEAVGAPALVVRTSGVFGPGGSRAKGGSFVDRILERARTGAPLRVVNDQTFSPTYAPDLAEAIIALIDRGARGMVHVASEGACTWYELAVAALETGGLKAQVVPIATLDLGLPARRPPYSVLSTRRYADLGARPLRPWRAALADLFAR